MAGARLDRVCSTRAYPPLFRERHLKDYNRKNTLLLADTPKVPLTTSQVRTCKTVAEQLRLNSLRAAQLTRKRYVADSANSILLAGSFQSCSNLSDSCTLLFAT